MATTDTDRQAEIERLRARVAALEAELVEQAERTSRIVADAQRRTYWLERWRIDLDALMRRRGAGALRAALRALRAPVRGLRRAVQALRGDR
jgi:polyhydroxyalkanoate synthesis regulator phasin